VGLADVGRQRLEEAVASYPQTPEGAAAMLILADLSAKDGDTGAARTLLQRILDDVPRSPAAREAAVALRRLDAGAPR